MAEQDLTLKIKAVDEATKTLKEVRSETKKLNQEVDRGTAANSKNSVSQKAQIGNFKNLSAGITRLSGGLARLGPYAAAAGAAIGGINAVLSRAIPEFNEQNKLNKNLEQSLRNMGLSADEVRTQLNQLNGEFDALSRTTNFDDEVLSASFNKLLLVTQDVTEAQKALKISMDLSATSGKSLDDTSQKLLKAYNGEYMELVELGVITKQQAENFQKMSDKGQATADVMGILSDKTKGASENLTNSEKATRELKSAMDGVWEAVGRTADKVIGNLNPGVEWLTKHINNATNSWNGFMDSVGDGKFEKFLGSLAGAAKNMGDLNKELGESQIKSAKLWGETQKNLIQQGIDSGQIEGMMGQRMMSQVDDKVRARIASVREERGVYESGDRDTATAEEDKLNLRLDEQEVLKSNNEQERKAKELQLERNKLLQQQKKELEGISNEQDRITAQTRHQIELQNLELRYSQKSSSGSSNSQAVAAQAAADAARTQFEIEQMMEMNAAKARNEDIRMLEIEQQYQRELFNIQQQKVSDEQRASLIKLAGLKKESELIELNKELKNEELQAQFKRQAEARAEAKLRYEETIRLHDLREKQRENDRKHQEWLRQQEEARMAAMVANINQTSGLLQQGLSMAGAPSGVGSIVGGLAGGASALLAPTLNPLSLIGAGLGIVDGISSLFGGGDAAKADEERRKRKEEQRKAFEAAKRERVEFQKSLQSAIVDALRESRDNLAVTYIINQSGNYLGNDNASLRQVQSALQGTGRLERNRT